MSTRRIEARNTTLRVLHTLRYGFAMTDLNAMMVAVWAIYLGGFLLGLLILWAVIRGAVLSALRKHAEDQRPGRLDPY